MKKDKIVFNKSKTDKVRNEKAYTLTLGNMTFDEALKKALNTPLPKKQDKKKKVK